MAAEEPIGRATESDEDDDEEPSSSAIAATGEAGFDDDGEPHSFMALSVSFVCLSNRSAVLVSLHRGLSVSVDLLGRVVGGGGRTLFYNRCRLRQIVIVVMLVLKIDRNTKVLSMFTVCPSV